MKKINITPAPGMVLNFGGGLEVTAIEHEGVIYVPLMQLPETKELENADSGKKTRDVSEDDSAPKETSDSKKITKEDLTEMETKDLLKLCKDYGIDPDATDGKNTKKKLMNLILSKMEEGDEEETEETDTEEEEKKPEASPLADELNEDVEELLEKFSEGKMNLKKVVSRLSDLVDDADSDMGDALRKALDDFSNDEDEDIEKATEVVVSILRGEKVEKPSKKGKGKEEVLLELDDLEKGMRVKVWWNDDNEGWYEGTVKSIRKGVVTIEYDDDTTEVIDPEVHTKIVALED